ncbi:unnamed protein product [Musa acuminata subsp. burmannicoides]
MEPIDLVPSGYRFLPTAEELLVDYLANCRRRTLLAALSPSRTSTAPSRGIFSAAIGRRAILCGAQAQEQRRLARRSKGRQRFLTLYKSKKPLSPWSAGARWWSGERAAFLSTMAGGRTRVDDVRVRDVFVWRLRDTSSLSRQEKLALCLPGGTTIKTVETTLTEAATDTVTGDSFVGRKRNRDESSTLGKASTLSKKPCWELVAHPGRALQSDVSPHPTAVVQSDVSPPPTTVVQSDSHLSSVDSVAPNEAGVAAASPSSMDVGGGEIPITTEELEAFLASSSSSVDLGGEQNCTDDAFFAESLKPCRCRMTPTQPRLQTRPHRQPL